MARPDDLPLILMHVEADIRRLVAELAPRGRWRGTTYSGARCPWRVDRSGGSFVVWARPGSAGAWRDYASGEAGTVVTLVARARGLTNGEAVAWLKDRYRIASMTPGLRAKAARRIEQAAAVSDQSERERLARIRDFVRAAWNGAAPDIRGTLADRYFAARAIDLCALRHVAWATFRFHPALEYTGLARWRRGERLPGPAFPALLSAYTDAAGARRALHVTWLARDGAGKAPLPPGEKAKKTFLSPDRCVIWITHGESGLAVHEAQPARPAGVLEGIEDGASLALVEPSLRTAAAGSLGNLAKVPDWPAVSAWLIGRDNDIGKPQAQAAFDAALAHFGATGKPVEVLAATTGKDPNDQLRAG